MVEVSSFPSHLGGEDELQDLSHEDAQELHAFQEKRRWFEGKLKLLEDLPRTYPFILPVLVPSNTDPSALSYADADASPYRLPSIDTLRAWQAERDALEEEVLAFDGGDLGRMKEKTREVTLVPLTNPSTQAVAITLDLILLIDRLLTLLRRRCDILELVALRLQWDGLRWKVMLECGNLKEELKSFVVNESRWTMPPIGEGLMDEKEAVTPVKQAKPSAFTSRGRDSITTSPIAHPAMIRDFKQGTSAPTSPTALFSPLPYPSSTTKVHPQSLSARHRSLVSTHLKRSSAILDRMIDIAGPLKDLGGLHGPLPKGEEGKEGGALPDELLDMQDDLELLCEDVKGRIGWCKELEEQKDRADKHYASISRTRTQADRVISQLRESLSQPASSAQHEMLADLLRQAESSLPSPIDRSFPRPSHPEYPDVEDHTAELISTLGTVRSGAKEHCGLVGDGVGWYGRLSAARHHLEDQTGHLNSLIPDFTELTEGLNSLQQAFSTSSSADQNPYLDAGQTHVDNLVKRIPDIVRQVHHVEMSNMAYKSTFQPPTSIRQFLGDAEYTDPLHAATEERVAEILALVRKADEQILRTKEDMKVLPVLRRYERAVGDLETELRETSSGLGQGIDRGAWKNNVEDEVSDVDSMDTLQEAVTLCEEAYRVVLKEKEGLDEVRREVGADNRRDDRLMEVKVALQDIRGLAALLERVVEQHRVVRRVEQEAAAYQGQFEAITTSLAGVKKSAEVKDGEDERAAVEGMKQEVKDWVDGLADRVPFVNSSLPSTVINDTTPRLADIAQLGDSPTIPLSAAVQRGNDGYSTDLSALDRCVRVRINDLSSRVDSSLSELIHRIEKTSPEAEPVVTLDSPIPPPEESPLSSAPLTPEDEDVFGSREPQLRTTVSSATLRHSPQNQLESSLQAIRTMRHRIRSLHIANLVFPSASAIARTPSLQQLPTEGVVESIIEVLGEVNVQAETTKKNIEAGEEGESGTEEHTRALVKLKDELGTAWASVTRLQALATYSNRSKACDEAYGRLMVAIDSADGEVPKVESEDDVQAAKGALEQAAEAAMAVENDKRVITDLKRLRAIWADLSGSLGHTPTDAATDDSASAVSSDQTTSATTPSVPPSPHVSRIPIPISKPRIGSSLSLRSNLSANGGMRSTSNPFPRLAASTENTRNRTASTSGDAARRRMDSIASSKSGLLASSSSLGSGVKPRSVSGLALGSATPSRIPRLSMMSPSGSGAPTRPAFTEGDTGRIRKVSMPIRPGSVRGKGKEGEKEVAKRRISEDKAYVSDPKSTLDQAVGKIVNKLRMSVPIVPVNIAGADEWKDQSGRYWIGARGRAKLCFCRILRSRTVMVRVGGGWMELSRFLMDHFADALWSTPVEPAGTAPSLPITPMRDGGPAHQAVPPDSAQAATPLQSHSPPIPRSTSSNLPESADLHPGSRNPGTTLSPNPAESSKSPPTTESPTTPIRKSHIPRSSSGSLSNSIARAPRSSIPLSRSSSFFSPLQSPHTPVATGDGFESSGTAPASPLVPLHFLKKASESPPVREREKERLGAGRRSILGKE